MRHPTPFTPRRFPLPRSHALDSQPFARRPYMRMRPPQARQVEARVTPTAATTSPEPAETIEPVMSMKRFVALLAALVVTANLVTALLAPAFSLIPTDAAGSRSPVPAQVSGAWFSGLR